VLLKKHLRRGGFDPDYVRVENEKGFLKALLEGEWDVILSDYELPDFNGRQALEIVRERDPDIPFVMVSGKIGEETAVEAIKAGASDYVMKDNLARLPHSVERAINEANLHRRQKRMQEALHASEEQHRLLAESITDYLVRVDKELRFTYWSGRCEELTGMKRNEVLGKRLTELFPDALPEKNMLQLGKTLNDGKARSFRSRLDLQGPAYELEISIYPSEDGLVLLGRDLSDRIEVENLRESIDDMEKQLQATEQVKILGQLASGVAHEVRNPLNAINTLVSALLQEIEGTADVAEYRRHIQAQVDRLTRLMQDLLDYGKPPEGTMITLPLPDFCRQAVDLWQQSGGDEKRRVRCIDTTGEASSKVLADSSRIQQVLVNLLDNAAQHSPADSEIEVIVGRNDERRCSVKIIDRGSGIAPEVLPRLFDPFFTTKKTGTGLGLGIVKNIVTAHGGTLQLRNNTPDAGCTVEILLPVVDKKELCEAG
jgi:PAS domain S-box-containing protein